ncbi:MAG: type-4 uracil-DNA glycosylase [Pyrodictiaceae archaeon]
MSTEVPKEYEMLLEEIRNCRKCPLHKHRKNPVPGEGPINASIILIGEAPGKFEDESGRPFVGAAGNLLTKLLELAGLKRSEVYITNIVKCRPPGNRDPTDEEINACTPYLWRQIRIIKPKLIITLGRHAGRVVFKKAGLHWRGITVHRGQVYDASIEGIKVKIVPTYHPAAALYKPPLREILEKDFREIIALVVREVERSRRETTLKQTSILDFIPPSNQYSR